MSAIDLTDVEKANVRKALVFLHKRFGTWAHVASTLGFKATTLSRVACGLKPVSALAVMRVARLVRVPVDDVLAGKYPPPGECPYCSGNREVPS